MIETQLDLTCDRQALVDRVRELRVKGSRRALRLRHNGQLSGGRL